MNRRVLLAVPPLLLATLLGCKPTNQANPGTIPDGVTELTGLMIGTWDAPGGPKCRWWITSTRKGGNVTHPGNTRKGPNNTRLQKTDRSAKQSQTFNLGHGQVGNYLHSDKCTRNHVTGVTEGWHQ